MLMFLWIQYQNMLRVCLFWSLLTQFLPSMIVIWTLQTDFFVLFKFQYIWDHSQLTECNKSTHFKSNGYLKFRCYVIARQYAIMRLGNMLKISLVCWKSEPHYAYQRYAYMQYVLSVSLTCRSVSLIFRSVSHAWSLEPNLIFYSVTDSKTLWSKKYPPLLIFGIFLTKLIKWWFFI